MNRPKVSKISATIDMLIDIQTVKKCLSEASIQVKGILHVGAHLCEEKNSYNQHLEIPDEAIVWVDANVDVVEKNKARGIRCYEAVIDETEREAPFYITSNVQSSSLLELGTHKISYPYITVLNTRIVKTKTLQTFVKDEALDITRYNFWNFDIQGNEIHAYKGAGDLFQYCDVLYTGVDTDDVYKGCGKIYELDTLLEKFGLYRVHTNITSANWGDALYVRKPNPFQSKEPIDINYALYEKICDKYGDAYDHLMTLSKYARNSTTILEFGGKVVSPTWAFVNGLKKNKQSEKKLVSYFLTNCHEFEKVETACQQNGVSFYLYNKDSVPTFMENSYDMIYLDTWHVYGQLKRELERFHTMAEKFIVIHGTEKYKNLGESVQKGENIQAVCRVTGLSEDMVRQGTQKAVDEFLGEHSEWILKEHCSTGYGLTVLQKV